MGTLLQENSIAELEVLRVSDAGAFLNGGTGNTNDDILLHKNQQLEPVSVGAVVKVFLYHDPSGRLTASMRLPKIKVGQIGYAPIINTTRFGAFVEVGTERGIFMPFAEMKGRPKEGEYVWVKLYEDKSHRLAVSMEVEDEMRRASVAADDARIGAWVEGAVYNINEQGAYLMTRERWIAFLHRSEWLGPVLIGQMIKGRITFLRDDGRINISLRLVKEQAMDADSEKILAFLKERNGKMPYCDKTAPQVIKAKFNLSKASFKRALGHLMKEKKIRQEDGWTYAVAEAEITEKEGTK
ncbi:MULTISPECIES: S1 RNA-binding domain-containing protein [Megasphaera]|uniref:S1 domain protein n=1 Tax=Megasphaera vaginalis (ex Srinivasan et al. 2021) TaxID=1111454 RepID=U7UGA8_9FIRM|nr:MULTISPECIES: S1-like domain-containing RNA-binding protein [Megasphaera]ERT58341.1 S1 domain protein [Megasphaera vaginalis (ex Srinivasan et al. 2021)]